MPRTISGTVATSTAMGLFLSLPSNKLADHWYALCNGENADRRVCNALLDEVVLRPRVVHAAHIRRLFRSDVCGGYGTVEMVRREEIAVFTWEGGGMMSMKFWRRAGDDVS